MSGTGIDRQIRPMKTPRPHTSELPTGLAHRQRRKIRRKITVANLVAKGTSALVQIEFHSIISADCATSEDTVMECTVTADAVTSEVAKSNSLQFGDTPRNFREHLSIIVGAYLRLFKIVKYIIIYTPDYTIPCSPIPQAKHARKSSTQGAHLLLIPFTPITPFQRHPYAEPVLGAPAHDASNVHRQPTWPLARFLRQLCAQSQSAKRDTHVKRIPHTWPWLPRGGYSDEVAVGIFGLDPERAESGGRRENLGIRGARHPPFSSSFAHPIATSSQLCEFLRRWTRKTARHSEASSSRPTGLTLLLDEEGDTRASTFDDPHHMAITVSERPMSSASRPQETVGTIEGAWGLGDDCQCGPFKPTLATNDYRGRDYDSGTLFGVVAAGSVSVPPSRLRIETRVPKSNSAVVEARYGSGRLADFVRTGGIAVETRGRSGRRSQGVEPSESIKRIFVAHPVNVEVTTVGASAWIIADPGAVFLSLPSYGARGIRWKWEPIPFVAQNIWENASDSATLDTRPSCSTPFLDLVRLAQRNGFELETIVERLGLDVDLLTGVAFSLGSIYARAHTVIRSRMEPSAFFHEAVVEILDLDVDLRPEWAREHRGGGKCSPGVVEKGLVGEKGLYAGANHSS
ncbi:hypothetical protein DFP72DRAFT_848064 [Ephemerocybe angulata]|uniref:Uncharacterized protein n=1 Tax=Ephemerocybe angulata TaxID=980116 RepID=A0A8H6HY66_9AGAR|nr:hypothetical protein DFP72DRAFT_848060 [Tulosesus angulatus]KAF6754664.1 hypothetical protein DFP72DRAFT_848062 [Tulosesus angulatus]KAF6754666.1 hypothetical protein DFP72DRAFT_848064 [Tulosesus angulatus]